jgi:hypothetical protein
MTFGCLVGWLLILSSVAAGLVHWQYSHRTATAIRWSLTAFIIQLILATALTGLLNKFFEMPEDIHDALPYTLPIVVAGFWMLGWYRSRAA